MLACSCIAKAFDETQGGIFIAACFVEKMRLFAMHGRCQFNAGSAGRVFVRFNAGSSRAGPAKAPCSGCWVLPS